MHPVQTSSLNRKGMIILTDNLSERNPFELVEPDFQ